MINEKIIKKLSEITKEEQSILDGKKTIDRNIYMSNKNNVINSKKLLEMGKLISIRPHTRFIGFPKHTHDYVEVVYMCSGSTTHIINGTKIVLKTGELLFLSSNAVQEIMPAGKDDIAVNFIILPSFFDKTLSMLDQDETPLKRFIINCLTNNSDFNNFMHFKVSDILPIQNLIENLLFTLIFDTQNKRQINQTTMGLLILQLMGYTDRMQIQSKSDSLLLQVYRYIEENYRFGTLSELAILCNCDLYWLSREIKRQTNKTFTQLLQEKRLSQAAYLLRTTKITVSDISEAIGYENISYFHKMFNKKYKLSPKKYRDCK